MGCHKPLYKKLPQLRKYPNGKFYKNSLVYTLRIGNMIIFNDLLKLGLTPRKSLTLRLPIVPNQYFSHYLRGYFDGDGCLTLSRSFGQKAYRVKLVFSSGNKNFLDDIVDTIFKFTKIQDKNIYQQRGAFNLVYCKSRGLKILEFMYSEVKKTNLYLERKYKHYLYLLEAEENRLKT